MTRNLNKILTFLEAAMDYDKTARPEDDLLKSRMMGVPNVTGLDVQGAREELKELTEKTDTGK